MFDQFTVDGLDYYRYKGYYYVDNLTIRERITLKEFKTAMIQYLINN